jgi:hypothetical protein
MPKKKSAVSRVKLTKVSDDLQNRITIITLIVAFPLGLIIMWLWSKWPKWVKIAITLMPVIFYLLLLILAFMAGTQLYYLFSK